MMTDEESSGMAALLGAGTVIDERFVLDQAVGSGGMAIVYRANDRHTDLPVAVKILRADAQSPFVLQHFLRESEILAQLRHPHIVRHIAHGHLPGPQRDAYLVMEWLEGEDLGQRLRHGALRPSETMRLLRQVTEALCLTHRAGIVHRDLKPGNLFLKGGQIDQVTLLDFGIARYASNAQPLTQLGAIVGTPEYMAPEQVRGESTVGPAADVFSLGCLLYECLTGQPPFCGEQVIAVLAKILFDEPPAIHHQIHGLPSELTALLYRMLDKAQEARPADAEALARELAALPELDDATITRLSHSPSRVISAVPKGLTSPGGLRGELQQLLCVVLASSARGLRSSDETVQVATLELLAAHQRDLLSTLRERGAHADFLVDGSLVVVFDNRSSAVDQAVEAAQAALLILDRWSGAQVAVSTGRGFRPGTIPVGEALDRAAQILMSGAATKEGVLAIGKVRVDAITAGLLSGRFQLTEQRGDVFLLEGNVTALDESRPLLGKPTPCVGRELELGQLEATLGATIEESMAQALVILGAPGSGKSRLRHEFLRRLSAQEKDVQILIGRGVPLSAGAAFGILGQALRGLCAVNDAHSQEERSQRFRTRIAERLQPQQAHSVLPLLAELAQVELVGAGGPSLRPAGQDPSLKQEQVSHALIDFLRAETTAHPVLLILEDLHWGDSATVQLVDRALQELAEQPLLVLVLARPEVEDQFPRLFARRKRQQIRLSGLGRRACERLIREALGQRLSPTLEARIIAQAAGNALFLEELIRAAAEGKTEGTSDTVMVMLQARLSRLPIEARTTLCAASIFGSTFWGAGLTVLLDDRQGNRVAPSLPILVELELIQPNRESLLAGEVAYSFRHDLMRDAAYELLTPEDRTLGHRLAAGFLESTTAPDPNVLAEHYFSGGDSQQAAKWFHRAATQALDSNELATAIARADRALQLGVTGIERGQVFALQATAAYWQRDEPATRRYAEQALTELPEGSAGWYLCVAHVLVASGRLQDFATVTRWLDAVLRAVPDSGALPSLALCLSRAGYMFMMQGRLAEMQRMREQLTILAIEIPDSEPLAMAQVHHFRSASAMILGDIMEGIREMQQTVEAFERAQDYRNALMERNTLACNLIEIGQFAEAERLCRFNLAQRERSTLPTVRSMTLVMLGYALTFSSRQQEAEQILLDAIASSQSAANRLHEGWARSALARLYFVAGALEKTEQEARAAMSVTAESAAFQSWPIGWLARTLVRLGRVKEALAYAEQAVAILKARGGFTMGASVPTLARLEVLQAIGPSEPLQQAAHTAKRRLLRLAERLSEPKWREQYLQHPEHIEILARCEAVLL